MKSAGYYLDHGTLLPVPPEQPAPVQRKEYFTLTDLWLLCGLLVLACLVAW